MCQPGRPRPHGESQEVSSPGLFAFQSAKSRGSSLSGFGSCSSTWSGRWPRETAVARDRSRRGSRRRPRRRTRGRQSTSCSMKWTIDSGPSPSPSAARPAGRGRDRPCPRGTSCVASRGKLGARPRRGVVDLVVDVGDVVDERRLVAARARARRAATSRARTDARCRRGPAGRRSGRRSTSGSGRAAAAAPRAAA